MPPTVSEGVRRYMYPMFTDPVFRFAISPVPTSDGSKSSMMPVTSLMGITPYPSDTS